MEGVAADLVKGEKNGSEKDENGVNGWNWEKKYKLFGDLIKDDERQDFENEKLMCSRERDVAQETHCGGHSHDGYLANGCSGSHDHRAEQILFSKSFQDKMDIVRKLLDDSGSDTLYMRGECFRKASGILDYVFPDYENGNLAEVREYYSKLFEIHFNLAKISLDSSKYDVVRNEIRLARKAIKGFHEIFPIAIKNSNMLPALFNNEILNFKKIDQFKLDMIEIKNYNYLGDVKNSAEGIRKLHTVLKTLQLGSGDEEVILKEIKKDFEILRRHLISANVKLKNNEKQQALRMFS